MAAGQQQYRGSGNEPVVITNAVIYQEVQQIKGVLQGMTGQGTQLTDHEARLRAVEKWRYAMPPTLLLSAVSIVIAVLGVIHG